MVDSLVVVGGLSIMVGGLCIVVDGLFIIAVGGEVTLFDVLTDTVLGFVLSKIVTSFTGKEIFSNFVETEGDSFSVRDLTCAETCSGVKYSPAAPAAPAFIIEEPLSG